MKLWSTYKQAIDRNCQVSHSSRKDLPYWQNRLFAAIMLYFLPFSLFALIPGIIMSLHHGLYLLGTFDSLAAVCVALIAFSPHMNIVTRKVLFILLFYVTAVVLLYHLGSFGPGLLYLMATTIFTILIFPKKAAGVSILINLLICFGFGLAIHFKAISEVVFPKYSVGAWVAVSSNLIILSSVVVLLLPMLFKGLQSTITELDLLRNILNEEHTALNTSMELVKHKNTELEQFAYMASHDMQEPLRMISKFLEELEKKYAGHLDEKALLYIHFATDGAERMKHVIADLLDYSIAGKPQGQMVRLDMNSLLSECMQLNQQVMEEKNAVVIWKDLPAVYAERIPLQQVFRNLVSNAIKYQQHGVQPLVTITALDNDQYWEFNVTDNGIGIAPENFEKIFIVLQRLHSRDEYPGNGIGLAICKKIIERHGGKIWVRSTPGQGTTFCFTLQKPAI